MFRYYGGNSQARLGAKVTVIRALDGDDLLIRFKDGKMKIVGRYELEEV